MKPNFFIVGAAKSGTSSLVKYLDQHPQVFFSPVKEPCYFLHGIGINDYKEYLSLFSKSSQSKAVGEASTGYLYAPYSASEIHSMYPHAKIIIILRNPVDMAISLWRYMRITGDEYLDFNDAISSKTRNYRATQDFRNSCSNWWANYLYIDRGLYSRQVSRYLDVFGRNRVRTYFFERFIKWPEAVCEDIFKFLDVTTNFAPDCSDIVNEGGVVRSELIRMLSNIRFPILRSLFPYRWRNKIRIAIKDINVIRGNKYPINPTVKDYLFGLFEDDVNKLRSLLSDNIPEWEKS